MASQRFAEPVTLEGRHVRLEPMTRERAGGIAEALGRAAADGALWDSKVTTIPRPEGMRAYVDQALAELDAGASLPFVTVDRARGKVVGTTRYMNIEATHRRLEIGTTWLARSAQRTAINTEAKYLMLRHAFEALGCIAVDLRTHAQNAQSRTAIERLGAKLDGILRHHRIMPDGSVRNTATYSIIDSEWPGMKAELEARLAAGRAAASAPATPAPFAGGPRC
jgi:RimJ/RimL family protein N-acetyltransferase